MTVLSHRLRPAVAATLVAVLASGLAAPTATGTTAVAARLPDLTVTTGAIPPERAKPGESFTVTTGVTNRGRARAGASVTRFYLSRDVTKGRGDARIGTQRVPAIAPGRTASMRTRLTVPRSTPDNAYYVIACTDDTRLVRESDERRNCLPSSTQVVVSRPFRGTLQGTLTFTDTGDVTSNGTRETWDIGTEVRVRMNVRGLLLDETFADDGSSHGTVGVRDTSSPSPNCLVTSHSDYAGAGGFRYTGDPFTDEIYGFFGHATRRELSLGLQFRYDRTTVRKRVGRGEFPCESSETTEGPITGLDVNSIEFRKVSQTARIITYKPVAWVAENNTPSDWNTIEGRLVLARGR